jgi:integrase/recombinase XerD
MNWNQYIKSFQHYLKLERGLSKNTIDNYTFDLQRLCSYLEQNNISVSPIAIQDETVQQFIYTISKELNARSQARILSGLKAFFNYLIFEDYRTNNPMELIETPRIGCNPPMK